MISKMTNNKPEKRSDRPVNRSRFFRLILKSNHLKTLTLIGLLILLIFTISKRNLKSSTMSSVQLFIDEDKVPYIEPSILIETWNGIIEIPNLTKYVSPNEVDIFRRIQDIRKLCGEVCDTSEDQKLVRGKYFDSVSKLIKCYQLFMLPKLDSPPELRFSAGKLPKNLVSYFTHDGLFEYHPTQESLIFSNDTATILPYFLRTKMNVLRKSGLIITFTTLNADLVSMLLSKDAEELKILSFGKWNQKIINNPRVQLVSFYDLFVMFISGKRFDFVIITSALEYIGLGRFNYGLNPWADLILMSRAWCLTKPNGLALVKLPTGKDILKSNTQRIYGHHGVSQIFANWNQVDVSHNQKGESIFFLQR